MMNKTEFKSQVYRKYENEIHKPKITKRASKVPKIVASFMLGILIFSGIVYARNHFKKPFYINSIDDTGIQTAIQNNYIQNIDMDYIEKDKVKFKVDYLIIDDIHLDLVFNFVTLDSLENYEGIAVKGLKITDENNNQISIDSEDQRIWSKNIAPTMGIWNVVEKHDNLLRQVVHFSSGSFPRSKKIYISFDSVILYNVNHGNPSIIEYEDNYNLEFDVSDQLINRKTIEYESENINVNNVKLTNSGLALTIKSDHYITHEEDYKITDEKGNLYTLSEVISVLDCERMDYKYDEFTLIFNFTIYDECNNLKLECPDGRIINFKKKLFDGLFVHSH